MQQIIEIQKISPEWLTRIFSELEKIYDCSKIDSQKAGYLSGLIQKFGYLPYPHQKALEELTDAETIFCIKEKLKLNNTYKNNEFCFDIDQISPVKRAGYKDSSWCQKEQHNIKLINLAGLGNGNKSQEPGKFIDWLKQVVTLPIGDINSGVLATTIYLIPFHPREFGCAYLPTSSDVSTGLMDKKLQESFAFDAKNQVQLFLTIAQLAGHPTMFDVLPQTGRFSKGVIANPFVARWFNIKELISFLKEALWNINISDIPQDQLTAIKENIAKSLDGKYEVIAEELKEAFEKVQNLLDEKRKELSNKMLQRENQVKLHQKAKKIINEKAQKSEFQSFKEEDIYNQGEIIGELISQGLWPAPGGAWNSCGIPIFDKMSEGASYPIFKHYNYKGEDVSEFANLDCQTPYYFVNLETGEYNEEVIEYYIELLKTLQKDYNFDGFRVDHIDHIVDAVSEKDEQPISYRAPRTVLGKANKELKKQTPHFATLAEYMLWEGFLKEYHQDMAFDLLWGSDIVSQFLKTPSVIAKENEEILQYNDNHQEPVGLSILKTYNNQDGEFDAIDQYPGQLKEQGALFKWFKMKFMPCGKSASRPVLHIDGDESFTQKGIESAIGAEISMPRVLNYEFYRKFNAVNLLGLNLDLTKKGKVQMIETEQEGLCAWFIKNEDSQDLERLLIIANSQSPTEKFTVDGVAQIREGNPLSMIEIEIPEGFKAVSEFILPDDSFEYEENQIELTELVFETLNPAEFRIFKVVR